VQAALDTKDPLYQQKRAIVQKNEKMRVQAFQVGALPWFAQASFFTSL
jgi:hypothetical protein